jgi:DNA-binding transcriptional ArsR family regulator
MAKKRSTKNPAGCPFKPQKQALHKRPLLTAEQTDALGSLFKVLSNDTRLRLLHALTRKNELCVSDLSDALDMKPQAISNQLRQLEARGMVVARKDGLQVFYRILDPCVVSVLDYALCSAECLMAKDHRGRIA